MNIQHLTDLELLAVLIGEKAAQKLLQRSLATLFVDDAELQRHPRIAAARELMTRTLREELKRFSVLASPEAARDYVRLLLIGKEYEVFIVLYLDAQNRVIESEELFRGTLTQTVVFPREVVKRALRFNAGAVIFAHNHPSGVAEASRADELLTQSLKQALAVVDIKVLDHFVAGGNVVMSFAERGLL